MSRAEIALVFVLALIASSVIAPGDYESALISDAIRKDPPQLEGLVSPVSLPSDCDSTVQQGSNPPLCYYFKAKRHETGAGSKSGSDHKRGARGLKANRHLEQP